MDNDILELIDQIEAIVNSAPKVPMVGKVMVDGEEIVELCERLRLTIPREVTRARRMIEEYDHRLAQAGRVGTGGQATAEAPSGPVAAGRRQLTTERSPVGGSGLGEPGRADGGRVEPGRPVDPRARDLVDDAERRARQIVEAAERQARDTIAQGERDAAARRTDADAYTVEALQRLERQLNGLLTSVNKGLGALQAAKPKA